MPLRRRLIQTALEEREATAEGTSAMAYLRLIIMVGVEVCLS